MQRFFVSQEAINGDVVRIEGDDARHISFSLRMKKGSRISVCAADGVLYACCLAAFGEGYVEALVEEQTVCHAEPPYRVRLYQALPKGDKLETIVQKAVECGVYEIIPFESRNCIAKTGNNPEKKRERLNRIAAEAAKQCGRGILPQVLPVVSFRQMLDEAGKAALPLFCYEGEGTVPLGAMLDGTEAEIAVVIGSEGGFTPEEVEAAKAAGLRLCGLGPRILRCETAPVFVLSCLSLVRELTPPQA